MGPVRPLWNPFLVAHLSLRATAVYSKTEVVPLGGGSCPSLAHADFRPPLACHEGGRARDNGPLSMPALSVDCVFVHYCALVPAFHKGVITIISTPLVLRCPCKITDISYFTRRSIVPVHFLSYLSTFRVFTHPYLVRPTVSHLCITWLSEMHPVFLAFSSNRIHPWSDTYLLYHSSSSISSKKRA